MSCMWKLAFLFYYLRYQQMFYDGQGGKRSYTFYQSPISEFSYCQTHTMSFDEWKPCHVIIRLNCVYCFNHVNPETGCEIYKCFLKQFHSILYDRLKILMYNLSLYQVDICVCSTEWNSWDCAVCRSFSVGFNLVPAKSESYRNCYFYVYGIRRICSNILNR